MGIPLKKHSNTYDDNVVSIDETKYSQLKELCTANIGHSIGTSETIYSKGY